MKALASKIVRIVLRNDVKTAEAIGLSVFMVERELIKLMLECLLIGALVGGCMFLLTR